MPDAEAGRSLSDYLSAARRRAGLMALTFVALAVAAVAVAMLLPAVYRSTATILIKEQEIPQEMVRSTVTSYADERIQVISQQVMTRATLLDLVDRYGLYGRARQRETSEEIVDRMRRDIRLTPISAEVTDRRTGSPARVTIAFTLAYESDVPANAQKIASELTTLFLNENVKTRQQRAAETTSFLEDELARVGAHISEVEQKLAGFKQRNQGRTPDLGLANLMSAERTENDLRRIERELEFLADRRSMLEAQLVDTRPYSALQAGGATLLEPEERLRALRLQLASARGNYGADHPDIRRLEREIAALEANSPSPGGATAGNDDREKEVARLDAQLADLRRRYSDGHPDVIRFQRVRDALAEARSGPSAARAASAAAATHGSAPRPADNPAYLSLKTQIQTTDAQIDLLRSERRELQGRLELLSVRVSQAPEIEREYLELARDLDSSRARFRELRDKQANATVAEHLERSRKAERFAVIEPPFLPERPHRPNRVLILGLGLLVALVGAGLAAALREALDRTVNSPRDAVRLLQVPVLATVPATADVTLARQRRLRLAVRGSLALLVLGALSLLAFHLLVMPLDVAWYSALRRMGL